MLPLNLKTLKIGLEYYCYLIVLKYYYLFQSGNNCCSLNDLPSIVNKFDNLEELEIELK